MRSGRETGVQAFLEMDRRELLRLAAYGGAGLLLGGGLPRRARAGAVDPASVTRMEFDVAYRTEVRSLPSDARALRIWIPLPPSTPGQEIRDLTVRSPLPYEIRTEALYGNRMVYVASGREPERFSVEVRYHVVRRQVGARRERLDAETAKRKYLRLNDPVRVTDEVAAFTRNAVGGATRPLDVARRAYDALIESLTYDKQIAGCGTGDTAWLMRHKRGKCDDYHALFMAMLVSCGVPVRWEQGFPLPYPGVDAASGQLSGDCSGAHCWVSFYDPEEGWVPVDVSEADKRPELREFYFGHLTPNRFQVSEGRSVTLAPPQGGDPMQTFAYAYAEADGIPLIYPANYENLVQFTVTAVEGGRA